MLGWRTDIFPVPYLSDVGQWVGTHFPWPISLASVKLLAERTDMEENGSVIDDEAMNEYEEVLSEEDFATMIWNMRVETAFKAITHLNYSRARFPNDEHVKPDNDKLQAWIYAQFDELISGKDHQII